MTLDFRQRLLATTLFVGASMIATPAFAQDAASPPDTTTPPAPVETTSVEGSQVPAVSATGAPVETTQDIIVTGSRIPQPNLTSTSPVTVVSSQEVKLQGTSRVEDLLNSLPQVFANEGSTDANGATGIATVDLRNLGPARTLVLINGRRLVPGDPSDPVADLNFIPSALIKRVDVLTGGASSVYGSDALAGVVNFIMDTDFTGVRIDAQASVYNHNNRANSLIRGALEDSNFPYPHGMTTDGGQQNITISVGANMGDDNRGHVMAYAGYRKVSAVTQGDRDFSSCGLSGNFSNGQDGLFCGGSSTSATGRFRRTDLGGFAGGSPFYVPTGPSYTVDPTDPNGSFTGYGPAFAFNFNPYNYFQRPDERYTFGAFGHYEVSEAFDPYMEIMYMDDRTLAQIAPSGAFYGTDFFVNCDNPFLSADQADAICGANAGTTNLQSLYIGRRNVEGGGRIDDLRHTAYRIVTGAKGDLARGLSYDAYAQLGRTILNEEYRNDFSIARLNRSLNVVTDADGNPICASRLPDANGIVQDPNCVPYNIFQPGGVSQAALDYLQTPGQRQGQTQQIVVSGALTAALGEYGVQSPWASQGVGLAVGAEYRKDSIDLRNDIEFLTGDLAGQGTPFGVPNASGHTAVSEIFGELNIPIASDRPFFEALTLNLSGRHSKYNIAGSTDAYKIAGEWAPTRDAKVRASYNRAVRAPNVLELFTPPTVTLYSTATDDPCSGGIDATVPGGQTLVGGATIAQCVNTFPGVSVADATAILIAGIDPSPAGQYNQRQTGNVNLKPEVGDSYTLGLVLTPRFIPRFSATIDAYDIRIDGLISTYGANFIVQQCVAGGSPVFCDLINRAPGSGSLFTGPSFVDNPNQNLGSIQTRGIDISANYRTPPLFGNTAISFDLVGTYLDMYKVTPLPGDLDVGSYRCEGFFGDTCGTPLPKWRHKLRATVALNRNISVSGAWRHFSGVTNDLEQSNELVGGGPGTSEDFGVVRKIKQQNYFDLAFVGTIDKYTLRLGAQNLFDRQPPITPGYSTNGSNTFAQVYDSLGRYLYASATVDF